MEQETIMEKHEHEEENSHAHDKSERAKTEHKQEEEIKKEKKSEKRHVPKKTEAVVYGKNLSMSTKKAMGICKLIKGKTIPNAIAELGQVVALKKVVSMKGEYAHQKGKGISSGKFPKKAAEIFITLLKSLAGNANVSGLEEPIIYEAVANIAPRPYGKFGAIRRKRTHVKIVAKNKVKKGKKK